MSESVYNYVVVEEYPYDNLNHFDIESSVTTIGVYKENSENFEKDFFEFWADYLDEDDIEKSRYYPKLKKAFEILTDSDDFISTSIKVEDCIVWIRKIRETIR